MSTRLSQPQLELLAALLEKDATPEGMTTSVHGMTPGNSSGNKLRHPLRRNASYGSALAALKRKGLVEGKWSAQSGVDLWRLTEQGVVAATKVTHSRDLTGPLLAGPRQRLSALAERIAQPVLA